MDIYVCIGTYSFFIYVRVGGSGSGTAGSLTGGSAGGSSTGGAIGSSVRPLHLLSLLPLSLL